ncbi:hypothetical protein TNCV_1601291 [Trichonephila clavipes]|nr:hypothetical protein TNCV_1601291 [Trichonephila clavipes]
MDFGAPLTIGKAYLKISMSSFLELCEWNTRNRWRDGQVCPDVDKELWHLGPDSSGDRRKKGEREKEEKRARKREGLIVGGSGEENPRVLLGDADQESETRMSKNALRTGRRQAVDAREVPAFRFFPEKDEEDVSSVSTCNVKRQLRLDLVLYLLKHDGVSFKANKELLEVAIDLGVEVHSTLTKSEIKNRICQSKYYDEESVKCLLEGILEEREKQENKEYEERRLARERELERLRIQLRNKLNENKLKAGNRINDLANVCILSEKRTTEVSESVNKCRPVNNPVVDKSLENATSCDFEKENCDPQ